jgi:hypothetical protein
MCGWFTITLGKRIGVSYGSVRNIAVAEGIKLIPFHPRYLPKRTAADHKKRLKSPPVHHRSETEEEALSVRPHAPAARPQRG